LPPPQVGAEKRNGGEEDERDRVVGFFLGGGTVGRLIVGLGGVCADRGDDGAGVGEGRGCGRKGKRRGAGPGEGKEAIAWWAAGGMYGTSEGWWWDNRTTACYRRTSEASRQTKARRHDDGQADKCAYAPPFELSWLFQVFYHAEGERSWVIDRGALWCLGLRVGLAVARNRSKTRNRKKHWRGACKEGGDLIALVLSLDSGEHADLLCERGSGKVRMRVQSGRKKKGEEKTCVWVGDESVGDVWPRGVGLERVCTSQCIKRQKLSSSSWLIRTDRQGTRREGRTFGIELGSHLLDLGEVVPRDVREVVVLVVISNLYENDLISTSLAWMERRKTDVVSEEVESSVVRVRLLLISLFPHVMLSYTTNQQTDQLSYSAAEGGGGRRERRRMAYRWNDPPMDGDFRQGSYSWGGRSSCTRIQ
jgi:hypothetical protein